MSSITELSTNYGSDLGLHSSDSNWMLGFGSLFAQASSSALERMGSNLYKGQSLFEGVGQDAGLSLAGAGVGILSNWAGRGITSAMGNSTLGRGVGAGAATALGSIGGQAVSNLFSNGSVLTHFADGGSGFFGTGGNWLKSGAGTINPYNLGMQVVGTALGAMTGPSKEYNGKYGNITKTMDSIYDVATAGANFIPGVGQGISAIMTLNKGLSNIFGSTDGMTKLDAILGSAFMPAPVKWLNMAGAKTTDKFENLSWQNQEKAGRFMQNAFGDLNDKFNKARAESNKTYGTFSRSAYKKANRNISFANTAWDKIMSMADERELEDIRSLYMSSINNQRYAQMINGGFRPIAQGKQGMKIFNNTTNHNIGQRLLSGAALIDNKAMVLSAQGGTKITRLRPTPIRRKPATREENPELWDEWEKREAERQVARLQVYNQEQQAAAQRSETNAEHALHYSNLATGVTETVQQNAQFEPVTQESLQNSNTEQVRLEQLADKNELFDNGMKFIETAGFADLGVNVVGPLLLRGFRWAFNKAGLLVRVPILKTVQLQSGLLVNNTRYYESPNKEAMKGVKYIEQAPSATSLDAEQQLAKRLESYTPKIGENGLVEYKPLNSSDVINIPEEAIEKQIQRFVDSGIERESAIEYLREQFGYGAMTQNGKTFLLPEKYMITNPEYMKAHDAVHRVLKFDDSFSIPGAEGLNPNEAVAMISGEIKPALGIQANEPLTEEMLNKWLITTNNKITGRYGFSSKIKDKKKFLEWANKVAPVILPLLLGGSTAATLYNTNK